MKEITKETAVDLFSNFLGLLTESEEEIITVAAKVAAAREKGQTGTRQLSKLDSICDNYKDQLTETFINLADEDLGISAPIESDEFMTMANEFTDIILDWYKKILIKGSEIAINSVLHPNRAKADKKEMHNLGLEFNTSIYSFIAKVVGMLAGGEELSNADDETKENVNFVLEVCEDKIIDLNGQLGKKAKKTTIVENVNDVKEVAEETRSEINEIRVATTEEDRALFGLNYTAVASTSGFGARKREFDDLSSRCFNA